MTANRLFGHVVVGLSLGITACGGDSLTIPSTTGTLAVTTSTTGSVPDPDGYTLQVDAQQPQAIGSAATVQVQELTPGAHNVLLTGLAANCNVQGDNPRTVTIAVGETTTSTFELTCGATTGALQVSAQTTGPSPDADGYVISFDGSDKGPLGSNASVTLDNLPPGSHVVGLSGVGANCQVDGGNLRAIAIVSGATATVTFAVTCVELPPLVGNLTITTTTGGSDPDANGYQFAVDGGQSQPIGLNASTTLANLAVGSHSVVLSNVAANCTVADGASKAVTINPGATATVAFNVTCSAIPPTVGTIRVTTTTTGSDPDGDGYQVAVDGGQSQNIGPNATISLPNIPVGSHSVQLSGVAGNCGVDDASKSVNVTPGGTVEVTFSITCTSTGPSASRSEVNVDRKDIPAGTSTTITVKVKDAAGHSLSGVTVTPTSSVTGDDLTPPSSTTNAQGEATFSFHSNVVGGRTITVVAGGVTLDDKPVITVFQATSTIEITGHDPNPSTSGQSVHVTFTVTGEGDGTPTGTVTVFSLNESNIGCDNVPVSQGSCDVTLTVVGTHRLEAIYSGDSQFEPASADGVNHEVQAATPTNQEPTAAFVAPTTCITGAPCSFDGSPSGDTDGTIATWSWTFGDAFAVDDNGSGANPSHTYSSGGTYIVTLTVTDNLGGANTIAHDVLIS